MIPDYLTDLQLDQVFSEYTDDVGLYLQESNCSEHIVDSEEYEISGFVSDDFGQPEDLAGKYFSVKNNSLRPFTLLQIDNGIIKSTAVKKCDCAIANGSDLCFIEFKANAFSTNPATISGNYHKAMMQIASTMGLFFRYHSNHRSDSGSLRQIEAYICFRRGYPRNTSSQMNYQVLFAANNNGIPLSFLREKTL